LFRFPPEAAQVEIELALHVGEQGAVAFPLQHGAASADCSAEVVDLPLRVGAVVADAVFHPVLQAGQAELGQQERRLGEEIGQAGAGEGGVVAVDGAGGALHQVSGDLQVMPHLLPRVQAAGHRRQGLQEGGDGLAVGRLLHRMMKAITSGRAASSPSALTTEGHSSRNASKGSTPRPSLPMRRAASR
jgi:hypothetical protein